MKLAPTLLTLSLLPLASAPISAEVSSASTGLYDPELGTTRDTRGLRHLAESRYLDGDLPAAARLYREAARLAHDPSERADILVLTAWLEFLAGHPDSATRSLHDALTVDPYLRFDAALYNKEFERLYLSARVESARAGANAPPPVVRGRIARPTLDPAAAAYRTGLGHLENGDSDAALTALQRAAALTYSAESPDVELRRKALLRTGLLYYERSQWGDAASSFEQAIEIDRQDADTWENLGLARLRTGELDAAAKAFTEGYVLDPSRRERAYLLARTLVRTERWDDAVSWIVDATRHHERDAYLQLQLGSAHAGRGAHERAERAWSEVVELDSSLDWTHGRQASEHLTSLYIEQGRFDEAAGAARRALEQDGTDAHFWNLLGLAQHEGGELAAARESFLRACETDDSRAEYRNNLGRTYAAAGDLARAEEAFVQALTLRPDLPTAQANLTQVRELRQRP